MSQDDIARAFSRLVSLRNAVEDITLPKAHEKYVNEYHEIITVLERASGVKLREFKVPNSEMKRIFLSGNYRTQEYRYSNERECDLQFLKMKINSLLSYFTQTSIGAKDAEQLGFRPPSTSGKD